MRQDRLILLVSSHQFPCSTEVPDGDRLDAYRNALRAFIGPPTAQRLAARDAATRAAVRRTMAGWKEALEPYADELVVRQAGRLPVA